jgi:hypothetical protein
MPQVPAEKSYFTFAKGLNTDASLIAFPDESTSDEANFELLRDGSRRRRRGLDQETGGVTHPLTDTLGTGDYVTAFKWRDAGSLGDNFVVIQSGGVLLFFADDDTPSTTIANQEVSLLAFKVEGRADTDVSQNPVSMDVGHHGRLIVVGKYIEPFYLEWDGASFSAIQIAIKERDFVGVIDNINLIETPAATTTAHTYNLRARGWKQANIATFAAAKSKYPAKNMWPWQGYRRTTVAGIAEVDGTYGFSADKMDTQLFGDGSAALGHLIHNPFDTTLTGLVSGEDYIEGVVVTWPATTTTITATAHGLANGNTIVITESVYTFLDAFSTIYYGSLDGTYVIAGVTANTFTITHPQPGDYVSNFSVVSGGAFHLNSATEVVTNPTPYLTDERPRVIKWYAGRAWYLGIADPRLKDKVFFSQIVENEDQYGKCYQQADPTDPNYNALSPSDGGFLLIPGMGNTMGACIFNDSLLVFSENGVWQIRGSQGFFAADNYSIRKLSDLSATSFYSIKAADDSIYWTGIEGINKLFQDPQTGFLTAQSISQDKIQTLWEGLPASVQARVKVVFDRALKKLYILYPSSSAYSVNRYDHCLVYSVKQDAFYKLIFPSAPANYIVDAFTVTSTDEAETNKLVKFIVQTTTRTQLTVCDMDQSDFIDFEGTEQVPYMVTGYDNLSDFQRYKQAPVLHVYCKKTETGYTALATDLVPIDESSVLMRPIWDWADHTNSGKYGPQQQVYRHRRYYQPVDVADTFDDGQPLVVTRNKLRGRGRVLHLRFDGETAKNGHIMGWSILYKANRKV